ERGEVVINWSPHRRAPWAGGGGAAPPAEKKQDVGGLADDPLARLEERWRKRRMRAASALDEFHHRGNAALAAPARHVDVVGARLLQRETDELAAPLDRRPVIEFVAHGRRPFRGRGRYAALRRGMIRSAFSRSIAITSAPAKTAPSPFTCSSPVRYGKAVPQTICEIGTNLASAPIVTAFEIWAVS